MFKSIGAVFAGFMVIVVLVLAGTPVIAKLLLPDPSKRLTPAYLTANLLTGFGFAEAGGWVAARLAPRAPVWHGCALAMVVLSLGIASAKGGAVRAGQPQWYAWTLPFVGAAGALLGAWW